MLSLSVELESLEGTAAKGIEGLMTLYPHSNDMVDYFHERGIYAFDATVFHPEDGENCKFIDLTTHRH